MQTQAKPRFRQDLMAELVEEGGQRFIDVADPDSGAMFRFFEVEYSIACAMDGERDVAGIVKWATDELGITPSQNEVQAVISQLSDLRFIGADNVVDEKAAKQATVAAAQPPASEAKAPAAKADDALAAGVVVPKSSTGSGKTEVELGKSGSSAPPPKEEKLPAANLELGASGAAATKSAPKPPVEDIALGAPGASTAPAAKKPASDISLDLSADMPVKAGDVKEAVRQSKVMTAVEAPKDLVEAEAPKRPTPPPQAASGKGGKKTDEKKAPATAEPAAQVVKAETKSEPEKAPAKVEDKKVEAKPQAKKEPEKAPAKIEDKKADEKKPVVVPAKQPVVEKTPVVPPAPNQGVSPVLIAVLILAVVAVGAYLAWKFILNKSDDVSAEKQPVAPTEPPPPPAPTEVTSKVAMATPPAVEIKAGVAGQVETVEPADKDVKAGDVIATLTGSKPLLAEVATLQKQIEAAKPAIDTAEKELADAQAKENNEAGVKAAQAKLDRVKKPVTDKTTTMSAKQADADKLTIKSTSDGKLADPVKVGDKVTADQVVAKVARPTEATATFKLPANTQLPKDGTLNIVVGDKTIVCKVSDAQAESVKVACPTDAGLTDGADAKFVLPKLAQ